MERDFYSRKDALVIFDVRKIEDEKSVAVKKA